MPTCLYCEETKPLDHFNREHVLPESFGAYEENLGQLELRATGRPAE
jgi:hypothetical protein